MKYLVLGASGQIGEALTKYLRSERHEVVEYDIVESEKYDLRLYPNPLLDSLIDECDFVFFLAFDVGGSVYLKSYQSSFEFISNNARIMEYTFSALKKAQKPFIFASSQMSNMLYSPYGILKAVGEQYTTALDGLIVKFWNVYGIERDMKKTHVITDFILKALKAKKIDMLTNGEEMRQFLFSEDASRALYTLSQTYDEIPRTTPLHITSFEWSSVKSIGEMVASHFPGTKVVASATKDGVQLSQRNEPNPSIFNWWKPKISLAEGIEKMVSYYSNVESHAMEIERV